MAAMASEGTIYGVDYSEASVTVSRRRNLRLTKAGRVEIRQASVSQLPFHDNEFDLVTAVETQYYWPDLVKDMQEILRALKPGGTLMIIAESYKGGRYDRLQRLVMIPLRSAHLSVHEHRELFSVAGFSDVQVFEEHKRGWICVIGRKPYTGMHSPRP